LSEHDPRLSFVSGHTSLAFCSASFLSITFTQLHPNSPWRFVVWPVSFGIAGTTGFLRFAAGKHFPTDILGAAAVGVFTGLIVPILHKSNHQRVAIYPLTGNLRGVGATIAF
jgi:membrane-associated phospholipid phosphatase